MVCQSMPIIKLDNETIRMICFIVAKYLHVWQCGFHVAAYSSSALFPILEPMFISETKAFSCQVNSNNHTRVIETTLMISVDDNAGLDIYYLSLFLIAEDWLFLH